MMSQKGLSRDKVNAIVQLCLDHGWHEEKEPNLYLYKKFVCGNNNIKIYTSKKGYSIVCNTEVLLHAVLHGALPAITPALNEITIDDAGTGSPIGGIAIGYHIRSFSRSIDRLEAELIDIKFFQLPLFEQKAYLDEVAGVITKHLSSYPPSEWGICICTGYVFTKAREALVKLGYNVRTDQITDPLQCFIENKFWNYLEQTCHVPAYQLFTPRNDKEHQALFGSLLHYIKEHPEVMPYCKTGWNFFKKM
jgi:hypothetical protein